MVSIPSGAFSQYYDTVDNFYLSNHISEQVKLFYIQRENCPNCIPGHPNSYKTGGPIPFSFGPCPYCDGNNFIEITTTENIRLRVYSQKKDFIKIATNTQIDDGMMQVIGKIENLSKMKKANYFLLYSDTGFGDWYYELSGEPVPFGFGSSQFACYIKRR